MLKAFWAMVFSRSRVGLISPISKHTTRSFSSKSWHRFSPSDRYKPCSTGVPVPWLKLESRLSTSKEMYTKSQACRCSYISWASWRVLGWVVAAVALLVLGGWLATTLVLWWDTGAIGTARVERRQLQLEIAELRANRDEWVKTGAQAKLERCGPKARPCVRVDERAGVFGTASDHRVLLGY